MNGPRDPADFEALFDRHHDAVFRYCHRLTGDVEEAEELTQEVFVRLLEHDVDRDRTKSWLFTVALNLVRDRARTRRRRAELAGGKDLTPDGPDTPDEAYRRSERRRRVRRALDDLEPRDRKMLLMREEGFSYAEIGEAFGLSTTSVGTILSRALRRFADAYEELGS
jgi:RNA polymerase sigma factor (sigma-70 family)